jgi:hypothetical protein
MDLADVRDRPFKYVVPGKAGQSGTCVVLHAVVAVVDEVIVSRPTGNVAGRMIILDGIMNYGKHMFHDSLSGVDA